MRVNNFDSYNQSSGTSYAVPIVIAAIVGVMSAILIVSGVDLFIVLIKLAIEYWIWLLVGIAIIVFLKGYLFGHRRTPQHHHYYPEDYQ